MKNSLDITPGSYFKYLLFVILITLLSMTLFQLVPMLVITLLKDNGGYIISNITAYHSDPYLMDEHINTIPNVFNSTVNTLKVLTLCSQIGTFLVPSLFIFWRFKNITLHVNKMERKEIFYLIIPFLILLGISQLLVQFSLYVGYDFLPDAIITYLEKEQLFNTKIQDYFVTKSVINLLMNVGLMAILPAVAEELFFRGILQPLFIRITKKKWWGIIITSIIFSSLHFQIDHLLAILFASVILGLVYEKKMNIYLNMLLHFAFNTFSLLSLFLIKNNVIEENSLELMLNYGLIPVGLICLMLSIKKNDFNLI